MTSASDLRSGKTHRDENFPVASWIIHPRHRALILSFYNFVRTADDIADHATLGADEKLRYLDLLEAELLGKGDTQKEAVNLRHALAERAMPPRHALDVLIAFRMDVTKLRYENWDEVIHYCRYSAMPVGRFMLDVHGESTSTWAASDALCAGLQINNHLQDCAKDYRNLNRVYLPRDALAAAGASVEMLGEAKSPPPLLQCLQALAVRTETLLNESKSLSAEVKDFRLGLEVAVIQAFADKIVGMLKVRDPLSERVHLSPLELLGAERRRHRGRDHPPRRGTPSPDKTGGRRMTLQTAAANADYGSTASGSSFYAAMRMLPREQREAMFQIYSFCRQVDDIADFARAAPGTAGRAAAMARRHRCAISGPSAAASAGLRRLGENLRPQARGFSRRSSTAWRWTCHRTFVRRTWPRSICIAIASRAPSGGCRCGCSACPRMTASCSPITSAARCN